ncbi:MAG: LysR family transcriptional regulator [Methylobacteriaceae bacterium]|nr:LysR family transcriptional regulator [Methylobacteriaceae bacterium]
MALTFKQLEAFRAVIAAGSVTRAAAALRVSQPAISRLLAEMEQQAGFALFVRSSRSLSPTARARALHAEVERSFVGFRRIESVIMALRERGEGQLRLAVVPSLASIVSSRLIGPFVERHPQASVSLEIVATLNALDWRSTGAVDLGVTFEPTTAPGVHSVRIGRTEAVCVTPVGHPLTRLGRDVRPQDLRGATFVSYQSDSLFRGEVDRLFAARDVRRDMRLDARTTAAVCELVAATGGVAIAPCPGPDIVADARLALLRFRPRMASQVTIVTPSGATPSLVQSFIAHACAEKVDFAGDLPIRRSRAA